MNADSRRIPRKRDPPLHFSKIENIIIGITKRAISTRFSMKAPYG